MSASWAERLAGLPPAPDLPAGPVVVLSAHPDDEVLAVGAWLAEHADRDLLFVTATDGEASHPDSPTTTADDLRERRPPELLRALQALGIEDPQVRRLRLGDGHLADDPAGLLAAVRPWLENASLVLAPFEEDGHPDHDALGAAALAGATCPVWRFPIWTWAWTRPDDQPWLADARRLPDSPEGRTLKRAAIAAFVSQVEPLGDQPADAPVVDGPLLEHAVRHPEVVVVP